MGCALSWLGPYLAPARLSLRLANYRKLARNQGQIPPQILYNAALVNPFLGDIDLAFSGQQIGTAAAGASEAPAAAKHAPGTGETAWSATLFLTPPPPSFPFF